MNDYREANMKVTSSSKEQNNVNELWFGFNVHGSLYLSRIEVGTLVPPGLPVYLSFLLQTATKCYMLVLPREVPRNENKLIFRSFFKKFQYSRTTKYVTTYSTLI